MKIKWCRKDTILVLNYFEHIVVIFYDIYSPHLDTPLWEIPHLGYPTLGISIYNFVNNFIQNRLERIPIHNFQQITYIWRFIWLYFQITFPHSPHFGKYPTLDTPLWE